MRRGLLILAMLVPLVCRAEQPFLDSKQVEWLNEFFRTHRAAAEPKDPLWKGLPDTITRDYPEREGFVRFEHVDGDVPPVGGRIKFSVPDLKLTDVFGDESFARLPEGAAIKRGAGGDQEVWDYPVGTRVLHRISLKSSPETLFELRLVQKMPDGKWAFGIYKADGAADSLPLHREGMPPLSFDTTINGQAVHVDMFRLSPASCRTCHYRMGHGGYQYPDVDHAGPCGFSPPNPHLLADWAAAYQARHGYAPFAVAE